jgi:hypothetical protein
MSAEEFVPVNGVVFRHTGLGIFLDVDNRRIFFPGHYISTPHRRFAPGEHVTIQVRRSFVEQQGLASR